MIQLVYASAASAPFTVKALEELLTRARIRNDLYSVTGMLLYHSGSFLQVLEGPENGIERIYSSIERDSRHSGTKILLRSTLTSREFPDWSMSFLDTSCWPQTAPGKIDYNRMLPQLTNAPTAARRYLRFFQEGLCRQTVSGQINPASR